MFQPFSIFLGGRRREMICHYVYVQRVYMFYKLIWQDTFSARMAAFMIIIKMMATHKVEFALEKSINML